MSRLLVDICPRIRPRAYRVIAKLVERKGVMPFIVDTLRTPEEQAEYIAKGTSWTLASKHLPQKGCPACGELANTIGGKGLSHALDLAPLAQWVQYGRNKLNWDAEDPAWWAIGEEFEAAGFTWGGRWRKRDLGHGEIWLPEEEVRSDVRPT